MKVIIFKFHSLLSFQRLFHFMVGTKLYLHLQRKISPTVADMNLWGSVAQDFYRPDALPVTQPTPSTH